MWLEYCWESRNPEHCSREICQISGIKNVVLTYFVLTLNPQYLILVFSSLNLETYLQKHIQHSRKHLGGEFAIVVISKMPFPIVSNFPILDFCRSPGYTSDLSAEKVLNSSRPTVTSLQVSVLFLYSLKKSENIWLF